MNKKFFKLAIILFMALITVSESAYAQRRSRPGSMAHNESEVAAALKETKVKATYIHDNAKFAGKASVTNGGASLKIANVTLTFANGKYHLTIVTDKFLTRDVKSKEDLRREGMTEWEYDHSWEKTKVANDCDFVGKYEVVKKGVVNWLILYDDVDPSVIAAKVKLDSLNTKKLSFEIDTIVFDVQYTS